MAIILFLASTETDSALYAALTSHLLTPMQFQPAPSRWLVQTRLFIQPQKQQLLQRSQVEQFQKQQSQLQQHQTQSQQYQDAYEAYVSMLQPRVLYVLTADHLPKAYSLAAMADRAKNVEPVLVEAERELLHVLSKLKNLWTSRQTASIEGAQFVKNKTVVRVGLASVGASPRGILIHISSTSSSSTDDAASTLNDDEAAIMAKIQDCINAEEGSRNRVATAYTVTPEERERLALHMPRSSMAAALDAHLMFKVLRMQSVL
ncbi:hypothetical protein BC831DRAFT_473335 [Entophlyctis helioformis]|nr:hypothetical protein BC831DRAFT_481947 [Entophlyctis helioformis]KAI8923049.1 hypothetical protein BC831DRAFT_473335 [Entophlyctis helioformis]